MGTSHWERLGKLAWFLDQPYCLGDLIPAKNHIKEKDLGEGGKMKDHLVSHTDLLVCH